MSHQKCTRCGRKIKKYQFCPHCGARQLESSITLGEIYQEWSSLHYRKIGKKTIEGYDNAWRHSLQPLKNIAIEDIRVSDYQKILDGIADKSQSLQHKLLLLIGQLCRYAIAVHRLHVVEPTRYLIMDGKANKSREIYSDDEIARLFLYADLDVAFSSTAKVVLLLIFTGARPEELFEVRKENVNLDECYIFFNGSKTEAGKNRLIPLVSQVVPYVDWFYHKCEIEYLISSPKGCRMNLHNWRKRCFYPLMHELGISNPDEPHRLVPYCCRHTYASLADRANVDKDTLSKLVGHTSYKFTKRTYIHEKLPQLQAETNKIDRLVKQEITNKKEREGDVNGCCSRKAGNRRERPGTELSWRI